MNCFGSDRKVYYHRILAKALEYEKVLIYGAHLVAKELITYLKKRGINNIVGIAVSSKENNPDELCGRKVKLIEDFDRDVHIIFAMPEKYEDEVRRHTEKLGFKSGTFIGLRGISYILGEDIIADYDNANKRFRLIESEKDYTWLDLVDEESGNRFRFPILSRLSREKNLEFICKKDIEKEYSVFMGEYRRINGQEKADKNVKDIPLNIYMVSTAKNQKTERTYIKHPWIREIIAGAVMSDNNVGVLTDDGGDSISEKNQSFAEMTAMYWIWKNSGARDYKGLCHYRRVFELDEHDVNGMISSDIDVVLSSPRIVPGGIGRMFMSDTPVKEDVINNMLQSVNKICGLGAQLKEYLNSMFYYPNNMFIAKEAVFNSYCSWIFPILFEMEKIDRENSIYKTDRHIAFAAELLTSFYFSIHKNDYKISVCDYLFLD